MTVKQSYFDFQGYTDIVSPALNMPGGVAIAGKNFEPDLVRGFRRINGFERFDGRAAPSDAVYYTLVLADTSSYAAADTITGATSGASATVVSVNADGVTLAITALTGGFTATEVTAGGGASTVTTVESLNGADGTDHDTYLLAAQDHYRDLIAVVPGSGNVLGAFRHEGTVYAFRANAGNTATDLYKSSASGWTQVTLGETIDFDAGTGTAFAEGDTITGATSSATATVERVITEAGTWGADAEGYLVLSGVSGGPFTDGENLQVSAATVATADGINAAISLTVGGRYEFISHNFYGATSTYRVYGCDGVNNGFEFDGTVYAPIRSGLSSGDTPKYVTAHRGHLFFSFPFGRLAHAAPGTPLSFSGLLGAADFGLGAEITGFAAQPNDVLGVTTRRQTYGLYGTSVSDWTLKVVSEDSGALDYTLQVIGQTYGLDDRGVIQISRTQAFGNFENATVSRLMQPYIDTIKSLVGASSVVRKRNQYRLYLSDGTGIIFAVVMGSDGQQLVKITTFDYGKEVTCITNAEDASGNETIYFGSTDGYVYQAEKGNSFDGEVIESFLRTSFANLGSPNLRKRWRQAVFELDAERTVALSIQPDYSYGGTDHPPAVTRALSLFGGGGYYDNDDWDEIYWDAQIVADGSIGLEGTGTNISFLFYNSSAVTAPFILQGVIINYTPRRRQR